VLRDFYSLSSTLFRAAEAAAELAAAEAQVSDLHEEQAAKKATAKKATAADGEKRRARTRRTAAALVHAAVRRLDLAPGLLRQARASGIRKPRSSLVLRGERPRP
jgi:hypothetical protein